jgi:nitroreductase
VTTANGRTADYPIDPQFLERWSPRAFDGQPMQREDLLTMFEAARWAPSSYNTQPWRFIYGLRDTPAWRRLLPIVVEFNQAWVTTASALVIIFSKATFVTPSGREIVSESHSFDAGCAWAAFALQALALGYHTHSIMVGSEAEKACAALDVPAGLRAEVAVAVGRLGDKSQLPDKLQRREAPSGRAPLSELVFEGGFPAALP